MAKKSQSVAIPFSQPPAGMEHHAADDKELAALKRAIPTLEVTKEQKLKQQTIEFSKFIRLLADDLFDVRENVHFLCRRTDGNSTIYQNLESEAQDFLREWFRAESNFSAAKSKLYSKIDEYPELAADLKRQYGYKPVNPTKKVASLSGQVASAKPMNFNVEDLKDDLRIEEIKLRSSLGGLLNVMEQLSQESQEAYADIAMTLQNDADESKDSFGDLCKTMQELLQKIIAAEEITRAFRKVHNECFTLLSQTDRFKKPSGLETED